jgi:glycosyltransferase involved in cell wall biosynthesis
MLPGNEEDLHRLSFSYALDLDMAKPLTLLVLAHDLQGRGMERATIRLLREFDRDLLRPELAIASSRGEFLNSVPTDVPIHHLGGEERRTSRSSGALLQLMRRLRPDCALGIHISAGRLLAATRILNPSMSVISTEGGWPFSYIEGKKGKLFARTMISRLTYRLMSHVVVSSDMAADDLATNLLVPQRKITLIPHPCVDDEMLAQATEPVDDGPYGKGDPIIITVGNLHAHKDQGTLIRAFEQVAKEMPSHLVIIGEGPRRKELERMVEAADLTDRVWFMGFQKNPFKYLARSTVFVSPSEAEGFDISQVEAMACGLPVVVTDAPRFMAVQDGHTGVLVPPKDPTALAGTLLRLIRSSELSSTLGANAKKAALEYSSAAIARRYEELIRTVVGRRGRG